MLGDNKKQKKGSPVIKCYKCGEMPLQVGWWPQLGPHFTPSITVSWAHFEKTSRCVGTGVFHFKLNEPTDLCQKLHPDPLPKTRPQVGTRNERAWRWDVELNTTHGIQTNKKLPTCFCEGRFLWPHVMTFQMMLPYHRSFLQCGYTRQKK